MQEMYDLTGTKLFAIPPDEESRNDLLNVDRKTKEDLRLKHRLFVSNDWEVNTIANIVFESLVMILHSHIKENGVRILEEDDGNSINFYDLLEITASNKKNESAEKTGNINVKFSPGEKVVGIISDNVPMEEKEIDYITAEAAYSYPDDQARQAAMLKIDKIARKILADKCSIILPKDYMAIATAHIFLENLYRELINKIVLKNKPSVTINMNELIEFHAIKKSDGVDVKLRPGMAAKLIIKSDEAESEYEDFDTE